MLFQPLGLVRRLLGDSSVCCRKIYPSKILLQHWYNYT